MSNMQHLKTRKTSKRSKPDNYTWGWRIPGDIQERLETVSRDSGVPVSKFVEAAVRNLLNLPKPDPVADLVWRAYTLVQNTTGAKQDEAKAFHQECVSIAREMEAAQ